MDINQTILNESDIIGSLSSYNISEEHSDIYSKQQISIFATKDESNSIAQDFNSFLFSSQANCDAIDDQELINQSSYSHQSQQNECTKQIQHCDSVIVSEEGGNEEQQIYDRYEQQINMQEPQHHQSSFQLSQSRLTIPIFDCNYQQTSRSHHQSILHFFLGTISDPIRYHHIQNIKDSYLNESSNNSTVVSLQALWMISPLLFASRIANSEFQSKQISKLILLRSLQYNGYEIFRQFGVSLGYLISEIHKNNKTMIMSKNNHKRDTNEQNRKQQWQMIERTPTKQTDSSKCWSKNCSCVGNRTTNCFRMSDGSLDYRMINTATCNTAKQINQIAWSSKTNEEEEEDYGQEETARFKHSAQYISSLNSSSQSSRYFQLNEFNQSLDSQSSQRYSSEQFSFSDQKLQFNKNHNGNNFKKSPGIIKQPFLLSIQSLGDIIQSLQIISSHMYLPYLIESTPEQSLMVHLSILAEPFRQLLHLEWQQRQNTSYFFPSFIAENVIFFFRLAYPISKQSFANLPISQSTHFEQLVDSLLDYTYFPKKDFPNDIRLAIKNELFMKRHHYFQE